MKIKLLITLALVAALALTTLTAASAAGPYTWIVDAAFTNDIGCTTAGLHCKTISAALGAASDGDTILVVAGTYTEQLNITKGVRIVGDVSNPDHVVIDGQNSTTMLTDGQVRINNPTGPVVFEGFKIVNTGWNPSDSNSIALGIFVKSSYPVTIQHNKLIGHGAGLVVGNDYGLWTYGNAGALTIQDNYLSSMYHGILLERQTGASTIADNTFDALYTGVYAVANGGDGNIYGGRAIEAITYAVNNVPVDITSLQSITGNHFVNFKSTGVQFSGGFAGKSPSKFTNVVIADNDFDFDVTDIVNLNGAVFLKNVSSPSNNDPAGGVSADIHDNIVHVPSGNGIWVDGLNGTVTVHNNSVAGNLYGLQAGGSLGSPIDATGNWWGDASGPYNATSNPTGTGDAVSDNVNYVPFAKALALSVTASTHELGETGTLTTSVTATGLYGAQLVVDHDSSVLGFTSGISINVPSATPPWSWDVVPRDFYATPGRTELSGSMRRDLHPTGANLSGNAIAQWNYSCNGAGTSPLTYDTTAQSGTILSDINGFQIPAALLGDSITCVPVTASSTSGVIGLQGRIQGASSPAGWNGAVVILTCTSGACLGYGPYVFPATDISGNYAIIKAGPGTGVTTGTYTACASRRAYLDACQTGISISSGTNVLSTPTLLGGNVIQDNAIDIFDLTNIGGAFGTTVTPDTGADINGDGSVNILDLVLAGGNYGVSGPQVWP